MIKAKIGFKTEDIVALNSGIWKAKKDKGLSLKTEIKSVTMPDKLKPIESDIRATHSVQKIAYGKGIRITI
jgi:hypothetical protein